MHLTYENPPDGNFFGFLKNSDKIQYSKYYSNLRYVPRYATNQTKDFVNNFKGKIAIYKNAYANEFGEFAIDNHIIRPPFDSAPIGIRAYGDGPVVLDCDKACVFGHTWMYNFGHFIHDYLSPLMIVPSDFLEECVVILSEQTRKFGEDVLKAVGVRRYIYLTHNEWVHADLLAVAIEGRPHLMHFGVPLQKLVDHLKIYFRTLDIKPTKYVIMNRALSIRRHINNIKDLITAVRSNIKEVEFEEIEDRLGSIESYAKFYPSIKCVFLPTGSNAVKTIFMHPNTVVIIASNEMFDYAVVYSILSVHIKVIYFIHLYNHHDSFNVDIPLSIEAIKVGVETSITGHFPKPTPNISFIDYIH
ncbi:hypothetical protein TVAG_418270 [Trichomonas vaginalis G3]|uniref:Glycosyltransferase 61 catalytic domain-containing protein n=2 Tax=Trichomonas vaginalis (strain ATCC PRA-98 / G3) TaxID=412133 RepID=A2G9H5_TRIV3|nr:glycosyltransferase family [Trichomonas vaginalis G3]EAX86193.1 hypothetical protein TVAG_418270 [Trichomonas vaginalis G3]KAI5540964.1 glycosyltransferase family [Trichomonas vaginalis G3]|eukprot:XP_001299123.1 hypothetical protein [Trichomonas vaginalis G3]